MTSIVLIIITAAMIRAFGVYADKYLISLGISRKDYFFYMCASMLPFAAIFMLLEPQTIVFSIYPILFLLLACFLRYHKQHSIVGCLQHLHPYESACYTSLGLIFALFIDSFLGVKSITPISLMAVICTLSGIFILADAKLRIKMLQRDLLIHILTSLALGYVTFFILKYWSNAFYIFALNFILTISFSKNYFNVKEHIAKRKLIIWVFIQQIFGFTTIYLQNTLAQNSVTSLSYVQPISLVFIMLMLPLFKKTADYNKIKPKHIFAVLLVVSGLYFFSTT